MNLKICLSKFIFQSGNIFCSSIEFFDNISYAFFATFKANKLLILFKFVKFFFNNSFLEFRFASLPILFDGDRKTKVAHNNGRESDAK